MQRCNRAVGRATLDDFAYPGPEELMRWTILAHCLLAVSATATQTPQNVLILCIDDLGVDQVGVYAESSLPAVTPNIDQLAAQGVLFRYAYANQLCSPTRATIQTGRYCFRTGIGDIVRRDNQALLLSEITLPEILDHSPLGPYSNAAFGKWHLGNASVGGDCAPIMAGYSSFNGTPGNITKPHSYTAWPKLISTEISSGCSLAESFSSTYAPTDTVDDALQWMGTAGEPFLLYVAFHAAHRPNHQPPAQLYSVTPTPTVPCRFDPRGCYRTMVEALDTELGRLLGSMDPGLASRTTVMLVGDNGTPIESIAPPWPATHSKGSIFEGGIRVPLIVRSPLVVEPGREVRALVNTTDLFATTAELAGIDVTTMSLPKLDSISLVPYLEQSQPLTLRETVYSEFFAPNGFQPDYFERAMRNERYKLIRTASLEQLYDLLLDPYELAPLDLGNLSAKEMNNYLDLDRRMTALLNS
jgi:arylsulfatase A-like enzyme